MIEFSDSIEKYKEFSFDGFFQDWKKPLSRTELIQLLENSTYKIIAYDESGKKIVGIITALSDYINWAFIPYLEVLPLYQGKGIGRKLLEKMLYKLEKITCIDLTCDEGIQPFYEKFGMLKSYGMIIRKY